MVFLDLLLGDLVADVPFGVVVPGLGARVDQRLLVLGNGVVREAQFDLCCTLPTFSSFCSWVYSFSKFFGTETLAFQSFFRGSKKCSSIISFFKVQLLLFCFLKGRDF